jgi:phasin family protein
MFDFAAQAASKVLNNTLSAVSQKDMDTFWGNWNDGFSTAFLECEKVLNMVKEQVTNMTNTTLFCNCDDFMTMGKTGFDAYVSACNTWAKGLETISKNWMAYIQQSLEKNMSMMKAISSCKNPQEVFTLQNDWAKSCMDNFMAESNKMSEMSVKTANEAFKPLQTTMNTCMNQVTSSFGTLTKKAA